MKQIITSLLENDLYKFTMQQLVLNQFPNVEVEFKFHNRGNTPFPKGFAKKLQAQINAIGDLRLKPEELAFLRASTPFLKGSYLEWLAGFSPDPSQVKIVQKGKKLDVTVKGPWYQTIYWEVPLMATISELYFIETGQQPDKQWLNRAKQKGQMLKTAGVTFADFGLRRRYSSYIQEEVVKALMQYKKNPGDKGGFVGTSNVYLAYKHGLKPIGTMAHELPMVLASVFGFQSANEKLMESWLAEYKGDLGIVLPDTFTTDVFLRSFDRKFAMTFDGVRQDSGDPFEFADKMIAHYESESLGIDPKTKTIVFSDGLNVKRAIELAKYCEGRINVSFGIGTNFSNDVGVKALNIVIKVNRAKRFGWPWLPTIKLSDTPGKVTGSKTMAAIAKKLLGI